MKFRGMERIANSVKDYWKRRFSRRLDSIQQLQIIIDETKIKRRFHICKWRRNYFYFLPIWEKINSRKLIKSLPGKGLTKTDELTTITGHGK
jgi:hypothetical protein